MRVKYQLWYRGHLQREVIGDLANLSELRAKFWDAIGLPWRGAEVRLVKA